MLKVLKKCLIPLSLAFFTLLLGCGFNLKPYVREFFAMDTIITIELYAKNDTLGNLALNEAEKEFYRIAELTTRFPSLGGEIKEGTLQYINANPGSMVNIEQELWDLLALCLLWGDKTDGAIDISLGNISDLWDFKNGGKIPDTLQLQEALKQSGYTKIVLEPENNRIMIPPGLSLDLGAVAKGYATDKAAEALREQGIKHALINAGGNVYALGRQPAGEPWRVGIKHPRRDDDYLEIVEVIDASVVTSGDYQRHFTSPLGIVYHHILNPKTGYPANESISVTVIAKNSLEADILSTALFVMGEQKGAEFAQGLPEIKTIFYHE